MQSSRQKSKTIYIGQIFDHVEGRYEVIEYHGCYKVKIRWLDYDCESWAQSVDVRRGSVKNPKYPRIYGVGYMGVGRHQVTCEGKVTEPYLVWRSMLDRCYNEKTRDKKRSYLGCKVCAHWHDFQNFADWFEVNAVKGWQLDKDLLSKGNKLYSPETCCFLPKRINCLLITNKSTRGCLPIGVSECTKVSPRYRAACAAGGKSPVYLGTYKTIEDAFVAYKDYKEALIKQLADEYRESLSIAAYEALCNYVVEATD